MFTLKAALASSTCNHETMNEDTRTALFLEEVICVLVPNPNPWFMTALILDICLRNLYGLQ